MEQKQYDDENCMMYQVYENMLLTHGQSGITFVNVKGERTRLTYQDIGYMAYDRMETLKKYGLKPHDFVLFQMYNDIDFVIYFWACMFGGFVPVLADSVIRFQKDGQETEVFTYIYKRLNKPYILVSKERREEYLAFAEKISIESVKLIFTEDNKIDFPVKEKLHIEDNGLLPEDPCMVFFTSGSTGMPKCVLQTNKAAVFRERSVAKKNHFQTDISLNWMPLEHAGGVLMSHFRAVLQGSEQIQVEKGYILEDPVRWLDLMDEFRVNYSWAPHFAYVLINKAIEEGRKGNWDLSCVSFLLDGGEMVDAKSGKVFLKNLAQWKLKGNVIYPSWGMCETCSGVLYNRDFDIEENSGVQFYNGRILTEIGSPIEGVAVRIVDENNQELPDGEIGLFQMKGAPITLGYFGDDIANKEAFTSDGWFHTGDRGFRKNNSITLTGREKDVVVVNGLNYSNAEIEAVIDNLDFIKHSYVAVCQCMSVEGVEEIIAFFTPNVHIEPIYASKEVMSQVQKKMHLKLTRAIPVPKEEILKSNLGKIQRSKMGKKYTAGYYEPLLTLLREKKEYMEKCKVPNWAFGERFIETNSKQEAMEKEISLYVDNDELAKKLAKRFSIATKGTVIVFQGSFKQLRSLGRKIANNKILCRTLYVLTERLYQIKTDQNVVDEEGEITGYLGCLEAECEQLSCVHIDLESFTDVNEQNTVVNEIMSKKTSSVAVAIRNGKRLERRLDKIVLTKHKKGFSYGGLYLITGGLGGIAVHLCEYLLKFYQAKILLIGRSALAENNQLQDKFSKLQTISDHVYYENVNVIDTERLENIIEKYEKKYQCTLTDIIHTAGLGNLEEHWKQWETRMIAHCPDELYEEMLSPKKQGSMSLYKIASHRKEAAILLFGSTNSFFGTASFSAYSAANAAVSVFATAQREKGNVKCFNFSNWKDIGMSAGNDFGNVGLQKGFYEIDVKRGILSIEQYIGAEEPSIYIGLDDSKDYIKKYLCQVPVEKGQSQKETIQILDDMEKRLAEIWKSILHVQVTSSSDDFFELGGDSIKAFSLPKEISTAFGVEYTLKDVFQYSTLYEMKKSIEEKKKK